MKAFLIAALIGVFLSITGCTAASFTARTTASWTEPGGKSIQYESNKDNIGLDATFDPKSGQFHIKVDKASTPEAAIAASQQAFSEALKSLSDVLKQVLPLVAKGAAGATGGPAAAATVP